MPAAVFIQDSPALYQKGVIKSVRRLDFEWNLKRVLFG